MGCISSKLLSKSGSFSETVNQTFQRRSNNVLEELLISSSKSSIDQQFLALLSSTNTATIPEPNSESNGSEPIQSGKDSNPILSSDSTNVETINTWDLLAGLEEENEEEEKENHEAENVKKNVEGISDDNSNEAVTGKGRSFRTVEDLDVILASSESDDSCKLVTEDSSSSTDTSISSNSSGAKRKARGRELALLELPAFEFAKSGSLRDWLLKGGQVFSPGSYATPKFGSLIQKEDILKNSNEDDVIDGSLFDLELLAQFEEAIEEMRREEESVLKEIVENLEGNREQERPIMSIGTDFIELNCQPGIDGSIRGVSV